MDIDTDVYPDQEQKARHTPAERERSATKLRDEVGAAAVVAVALTGVYALRLLHGMGFVGDSIKWQFVVPTAGVGHEPGNPVYLMFGWLIAQVPIGDVGTRVNTASTIPMIVACVLFYFALRELSVRRSIAVAFSIGLGVTPVAVLYAVVAEVHALHLAFVAAILLVLLRWQKNRSDRYLYLLIGLVALSFGNHLNTMLLVPGILVFLWKVDRKRAFSARMAVAAGVGASASVALYYYLIWRAGDASAFYLELMPRSFGDLVDMWTGGRYRNETIFDATLQDTWSVLLPYFTLMIAASFAALIPLIVVGYRRAQGTAFRPALTLWAAGTAVFIFGIGSRPVWMDPYLLPLMLVLAFMAAYGAEGLAQREVLSRMVGGLVLVAVVVLMAVPHPVFLARTDWSQDYARQQDVRSWLTDLPDRSVIAARYQAAMASWYMISIERVPTDVEVLHLDALDLDIDVFSILDDYLEGNPGYTWQLRREIEPGRAVFAPTDPWMCELVGAGFGLEPYADGMYRVVARRGALPPAERLTFGMSETCSNLGIGS